MTSGAAIWAGAGEPGRAWASNENIKTIAPQTKIEAIFNIYIYFLLMTRWLLAHTPIPQPVQ
jgi:hypothetical protein